MKDICCFHYYFIITLYFTKSHVLLCTLSKTLAKYRTELNKWLTAL